MTTKIGESASERLARASAEGRAERGLVLIRRESDEAITARATEKMRSRLEVCQRAINALLADRFSGDLWHPALAPLSPRERKLVIAEVARQRAAGVTRVQGIPAPPARRLAREAAVVLFGIAVVVALALLLS